jgi:pimeloyl-ACP methyl ester carboxylesterase
VPADTDRDLSADFDCQVSAVNSVCFLGLSPPAASKTVSFYPQVAAPIKDLVWFERSAHFPVYEEPKLFNETLIRFKGRGITS